MASNFQDDACDFMIPIQWSVGRVSTYLSWCMQKIGFPDLDYYEIQPWQELDKYTVYRNRQVRINVSTQKPHFHSCSWGDCCMDVQTEGVSAQCDSLYALHEVTGLRFSVHAVLITKAETAKLLLGACQKIQTHGLNEFCFMSSCATTAVGCATLLIMLKYPLAQITLSTRFIDEARLLGYICMPGL